MRVSVVAVGRGACSWADAAAEDYGRRVRRWAQLEERQVKPAPFRGDIEAVRSAEAARLLKGLAPRDWLVALDERGEDLDTDAFRALVEAARLESAGLVFVIGGAYGLHPDVRRQARRTLRLSSLVLNHQVARVVLHEQLYRALAAMHGVPYHH